MLALAGGRSAEQAGGAADDLLKLLDRVEVEPDRDSEAVAQRRGQQALPGGRADQGEARQVDPDRARRGAFADHQVERAVLHRRVEHFLDRRIEAVDLVDEQDVAVLEVGEQARRGRPTWRSPGRRWRGSRRPFRGRGSRPGWSCRGPAGRRTAHGRAPRRASLRGVDEDAQILARRLLADELVEALRAQRGVGVLGGRSGVVMRAGSVALISFTKVHGEGAISRDPM